MNYSAPILIAGFVGGALRGIVGYIKYQTKYKNVDFKPWHFAGMTATAGVVGLLAAWATKDLGVSFAGVEELPSSVAFIIGYAGGDFIENLFKIISGKSVLYSIGNS
ncbi:MAG: hypothetical protein U9M92_02205 [Patescibacteria group bacterium]|nr:hypothetical protein [Patescibacteria group bacterium]